MTPQEGLRLAAESLRKPENAGAFLSAADEVDAMAARIAALEAVLRQAVPWVEDGGEHFADDRTWEDGRCERCLWLHQVAALTREDGR